MTVNKMFLASVASTALVLGAVPALAQAVQADTQTGVEAEATTPVADVQAEAQATTQADAATTQPATGAVTAATAADVTTGTTVFDQAGAEVGKIESASAEGAVIATGKSRVQIPIASFGKNSKGLVIAMSKSQLDAAAAGQTPS